MALVVGRTVPYRWRRVKKDNNGPAERRQSLMQVNAGELLHLYGFNQPTLIDRRNSECSKCPKAPTSGPPPARYVRIVTKPGATVVAGSAPIVPWPTFARRKRRRQSCRTRCRNREFDGETPICLPDLVVSDRGRPAALFASREFQRDFGAALGAQLFRSRARRFLGPDRFDRTALRFGFR